MSENRVDREIRSLKLTVGVYLFVFAIKLVAYFLTHVMAIMAEALHTLSDLFISGFLLMALIWSKKSADEVHPFGHGRAQNVAALLAATLFISFTSFKLYEEAIPKLFQKEAFPHENLGIAVGVLIISMLVAAAPLFSLFKQKGLGAAAKAQLIELVNDELGLLAALVGTILISLGFPLADPIAAIIVATIIAVNAVGVFRENLDMVIGRSPSSEYLEKVRQLALSVEGVKGIHRLRAEYVGPETIHVDMHIEVPKGTVIEEASVIARRLRKIVEDETECDYCNVHVDAEGTPHAP